jgi:hypothetical protein
MPLFQLLQTPFVQGAAPTFWVGRVISIISLLLSAVLIGCIIGSLSKDWMAAAISGAVLFCFPHLAFGSVVNQPDTLALALSLGAVLLLVRWPTRTPAIAVAALVCAAAVFAHQRYLIAVPLGGFLWLWRSGARQQAGVWMALVSALCVLGFVALNAFTAGGALVHLVGYNTLSFRLISFIDTMLNLSIHAGFVLIGGLLLLIVERLEQPHPMWRLVSSYGFAALISALTVARPGGSLNDLYEAVAAIALLVGASIAWVGFNHRWLKIAGIAVVALQAGSLNAWGEAQYLPPYLGKVNNVRETVQLAQITKEANGSVLADEFMGLLPLNNQPIRFQPFEYNQLQQAGWWNEAALIGQIERREFKLILLYETSEGRAISIRWSPALRKAIYAHYDKQQLLADVLVYVPKSR